MFCFAVLCWFAVIARELLSFTPNELSLSLCINSTDSNKDFESLLHSDLLKREDFNSLLASHDNDTKLEWLRNLTNSNDPLSIDGFTMVLAHSSDVYFVENTLTVSNVRCEILLAAGIINWYFVLLQMLAVSCVIFLFKCGSKAQRELMLSPPVWSIGVIGNRYKLRNRYYNSVAGVWLVFFASLAHAVPIATEQYIALRAVLDGLGCVPSAKNSTCSYKFLSSSYDCTTANLLQCNSAGNVTYLYLRNTTLTGTVSSEIGRLVALTVLRLDSNQLTGVVPSEIGQLTLLQLVSLSSNQLTGVVPSEIGKLTVLQRLELNDNKLTGTIPAEIGTLAKFLFFLFLSSNQLSGAVPTEIGKLTRLNYLGLSLNQLTGTVPSEIGKLTMLNWLYLRGNQLTGVVPTEIGKLTMLSYLSLQNNRLNGVVPFINATFPGYCNLQFNNETNGGNCFDLVNSRNCLQNGGNCTCEPAPVNRSCPAVASTTTTTATGAPTISSTTTFKSSATTKATTLSTPTTPATTKTTTKSIVVTTSTPSKTTTRTTTASTKAGTASVTGPTQTTIATNPESTASDTMSTTTATPLVTTTLFESTTPMSLLPSTAPNTTTVSSLRPPSSTATYNTTIETFNDTTNMLSSSSASGKPTLIYGVVGGVVGLVLLTGVVALLLWLRKRRNVSRLPTTVDTSMAPVSTTNRVHMYGSIADMSADMKSVRADNGNYIDASTLSASSQYAGMPSTASSQQYGGSLSSHYANPSDVPQVAAGSFYTEAAGMFVDVASLTPNPALVDDASN